MVIKCLTILKKKRCLKNRCLNIQSLMFLSLRTSPVQECQKSLVKSTSTVYNSSLPIHILLIRTILPSGRRDSKFPIGPKRLKPGPMFPRVVIEVVTELISSTPSRVQKH
ncbi:hypothetical protein MSSIT_1549 [Methanosarcina siciliae T4/M]|uniref:Uncharacterized protein n=1 Tax=Methanosarcina siciliae T4/M TaxID=1434120 RepID=A0A0E3P459_9EURY|nr:hypothetical protein MSSIT_1549 [Methanosarcina siciliae T4/M]